MSGLYRLMAALACATCVVLGIAYCAGCGGPPPFNATDKAELRCIEETDAGANAGRAALKAAIADCRYHARSDGGV